MPLNPAFREQRQMDLCEFTVRLVYIESSRTARAVKGDCWEILGAVNPRTLNSLWAACFSSAFRRSEKNSLFSSALGRLQLLWARDPDGRLVGLQVKDPKSWGIARVLYKLPLSTIKLAFLYQGWPVSVSLSVCVCLYIFKPQAQSLTSIPTCSGMGTTGIVPYSM